MGANIKERSKFGLSFGTFKKIWIPLVRLVVDNSIF